MAIDYELIGKEFFNEKFKNRLRDFYVYQFKNKNSQFRIKGKKTDKAESGKDTGEEKLNRRIPASTMSDDVLRLRTLLEAEAGLSWHNTISGCECITVDTRKIQANPFHKLYRFCNESANEPGSYFSLIYALLLYFSPQFKLNEKAYQDLIPDENRKKSLFDYLEFLAEDLYSQKYNSNPLAFKYFDREQRLYFGEKAANEFYKVPDEYDDIHQYTALFKKKIIYDKEKQAFDIIDSNDEWISQKTLFYALSSFTGIRQDQFSNKMSELAELGIIQSKDENQTTFYAPNNIFLSSLINKDQTDCFINMISFFSEIYPLGEVGSFILNRFSNTRSHIYFKHNYIKNVLGDYNTIDLLYALQKELWIKIEYRNANVQDLNYQEIIAFPLEIRESVTDGRQYLLYYHPEYHSVSALRIEFIDKIILGTLSEKRDYFEAEIERAKKLIEHTWGTSFADFKEGNVRNDTVINTVKLVIKADESETFITRRLYREQRKHCVVRPPAETEQFGRCIEFTAEIADYKEILQWIRSFTTRIVSISVNGKEYEDFWQDIEKNYNVYKKNYNVYNLDSDIYFTSESKKDIQKKEVLFDKIDFIPIEEELHSILFNEVYSVTFEMLGCLFDRVLSSGQYSIKDIDSKVNESISTYYSLVEKRKKQAKNFISYFFNNNAAKFIPADKQTSASIYELLPLTAVELQWIENILKDKHAELFFTKEEISEILEKIPQSDLFDINKVICYNQFTDVSEMYDSDDYGKNFRTILWAINNQRKAMISYTNQYGKTNEDIYSPAFIEYSKRDDKFRVYTLNTDGNPCVVNLERINQISVCDEDFDLEKASEHINSVRDNTKKEITVIFKDIYNIVDRILTEFSPWEKKCICQKDGTYIMNLSYDAADTMELVVRLLSYGPHLFVSDDSGSVRQELISRFEQQMEIKRQRSLIAKKEQER